MSEKLFILTPVGRIVSGHPATENTTGYQNAPLVDKQGNPKSEYYFAIAVEQTNPEWEAFWNQIVAVAQRDFPGGQWQQPFFKWKISNGNSPEYASKEGYAGHHIINMKSGFAPSLHDMQCNQIDGSRIKKGDYVRVQISVQGNKDTTQNAGLFINPSMVQLCGYGPEILTGPSAQDIFGQAPVTNAPTGMSATPVAPVNAPAPPVAGVPGMPAPAPAAPVMPVAPPAVPTPAPVPMQPGIPATGAAPMTAAPSNPTLPGNVQPAYDFLQPGAPAPAAPAAPTPAAPAAPPAAPVAGMPGIPAPVAPPAPGMPVTGAPAVPHGVPHPAYGGDYIPH